jgi:hypothetical protein
MVKMKKFQDLQYILILLLKGDLTTVLAQFPYNGVGHNWIEYYRCRRLHNFITKQRPNVRLKLYIHSKISHNLRSSYVYLAGKYLELLQYSYESTRNILL